MDEITPHCDSKMVEGSKRRGKELEEDSNGSGKHVKIRDVQAVLHSDGSDAHEPETFRLEESENHVEIVETQGSQIIDKNASETRQLEGGLKKPSTPFIDSSRSKPLDLNTEVCTDENSGYNDDVVCLGDSKEQSSYGKGKAVLENTHMALSSSGMDLNFEDVASSVNHDSFNSYRMENYLKMRDNSDSGKSTGHLEDKDYLNKWKEMKKNGFMSSMFGCGGIPAAPKQRGRKRKNEVLKQKMEQAKKEQIDRFTKMAAPSGLLNGLNPGIINHVRNSKQVHSIIQALMRSEKQENSRQAKLAERNTEQENAKFSGKHGNRTGYRDSIEESGCAQPSLFHSKVHSEDDTLKLKLASSTKITSCVSIEESMNDGSVDSLSVKAATVASQWLQLLHQDIKGRLAALRRSQKRVRAVISTEFPILLSTEFPSNQASDPCALKDSASGYSYKARTELHRSYWSKLFNQMDCNLFEEEKHLENWLNQVNKMMLHCDQGLQHIQLNSILEMQHLGSVDNNLRSGINDPDKELSVRAAAASIYSTCNFLSSRGDVSCF